MAPVLDVPYMLPTSSLQIIEWEKPPEPKQPSQCKPSKASLANLKSEHKNEGDSVPTLDEFKPDDSTLLGQEEGVMPMSGESTMNEASRQPALSKGSTQKSAIVIDDSQADSELDEGDSHNDDASFYAGDQHVDDLEYCDEKLPAGTSNTITLELGDSHWRSPSTPMSPSIAPQPTREPSSYIPTQVTTHPPKRTTKNMASRKGTSKSISSRSGTRVDTDDNNYNDNTSSNYTTPVVRKRKCLSPATRPSPKRQTRGRNVRQARRQEWPDREESSDEDSRESDCFHNHQERSTPITTRQARVTRSRSDANSLLFNPTPPHASRKARGSVKIISPGGTQWRAADIALHSLPGDASILTAFFHARNVPAILSPSCAVKLQLIGADAASAPHGRPSYNVDNEISGDDSDISDGEHPDDIHEVVPSSGKHRHQLGKNDIINETSSRKNKRWSIKDDNRLRLWMEEEKTWGWIRKRFPNRSIPSIRQRWYKLRKEA